VIVTPSVIVTPLVHRLAMWVLLADSEPSNKSSPWTGYDYGFLLNDSSG